MAHVVDVATFLGVTGWERNCLMSAMTNNLNEEGRDSLDSCCWVAECCFPLQCAEIRQYISC